MAGPSHKPRRSLPDEGDGDLGLQGLHLESSPPRSSRPGESPTEKNHTLHVIMSRFGSQNPAKASPSSFASSSYFSPRDEGDFSRLGSPTSPGLLLPANELSSSGDAPNRTTDSSDSPSSPTSKSRNSKAKNRFSKLRLELAGSERPLIGSSSGPSLSPRTTSSSSVSRRSSSYKVEMVRSSSNHKVEMSRNSSSNSKSEIKASGSADLSTNSIKSQPMVLTGGTSSTGLLRASPFASSFETPPSSTDTQNKIVSVPGRRTSLPVEKGKKKNRSGAGEGISSLDSPERQTLKENQSLKPNLTVDSGKKLATLTGPNTPAGSVEASLQRWVLSVGCVNFDLDKGPDLEFLYPSLGISREERDNIAFSSFPDTSIFDDGHAVFSWRVREVPLDSSVSEAPIIGGPKKQRTASQSSDLPSPTSPTRRFSTLPNMPRKGSHSGNSNQHHKLWNFDRGWKQPGGIPSSDEVEPTTSAKVNSNSSSRSVSPLPPLEKRSNSSNQSPTCSSTLPLDSTKMANSLRRLGSDETAMSATSEEGATNLPAEAATLVKDDTTTSSSSSLMANGAKTSMSSNFIHGYCYFRQKRDATIRRGYFQKSIVILSHLPYVSLFSEIVKKLGPLFFEIGMPALESFSQDVQNWPPPEPGARMHLPLLGSVLSVDLPYQSQFQTSLAAEARIVQNLNAPGKARSGLNVKPDSRGRHGSEDEPILASVPLTPLFDIFRESLDDLWLLWECILLADPILVVGPDPRICSEAVWHLLDLIRPIPFAGDFRPFFTIHDYDFKTLVTKNKPNAGVVLGVTNPFMLQACKHWPHVFKVGKGAIKTVNLSTKGGNRKPSSGLSSSSFSSSSPNGGGGGIAGGNSAGGGGPEHTPGMLSKRKRRISKDRPLLRKLREMAENGSDDEAANAMLRRYFSDLTEMFLAPLNRYVSSLIPANFDLSSPTETPRIKPFNTMAFLASLKTHGTPLPIRSRNLPTGTAVRQSLYMEFLQCPNFSLWLQDRITLSEEEQYNRKLRALESGSITDFVSSKSELETIDLYSRLSTEIGHIDEKLKAGKRERELEPNSRWKSSVTPKRDVSPALALSSEPSTSSTAKKIQELVRTSGNALTSGEKTLLIKKVHLIEQLDTLVNMLPTDTRDSLQLRKRTGPQVTELMMTKAK